MTSRYIKSARCEDVLNAFMAGSRSVVFFTLTTPDVVDYEGIRARWRRVRHYLVELLGKDTLYIMNFELHPKGHGWHIHGVINRFVNLRLLLRKIQSFGFGRVDFRRVNSSGVANYLTKHCLKAYRGISRSLNSEVPSGSPKKRLRLVNCSRGLPPLSSYHWESSYLNDYRSLFRRLENSNSRRWHTLPFAVRSEIVDIAVQVSLLSVDMVLLHLDDFLAGNVPCGTY